MSKKVIRKIVDIYPNGPIYTVIPPIMSNAFKVDLSIGDIANCINSRAIVKETLIDGREIGIGLSNYDTDNNEGIIIPEVEEEPKIRESRLTTTVDEEPVVLAAEETVVEVEPVVEAAIVESEPVEPSVEESVESMIESQSKYNNNKGKNKGR